MPSGEFRLTRVVLAPAADPVARWVVAGLAVRGENEVRHVTVEELAWSTSITHEMTSESVHTRVRLADGTVFGPDLVATLNRMTTVPDEHLVLAAEADRQYSRVELGALFVSLLAGLPGRVLGAAGPLGLGGPWLRRTDWLVAAAASGLPVAEFRSGAPEPEPVTHRLIVVGRRVHPADPQPGPVDPVLARGAVALADRVGTNLLGLGLTDRDGPMRVVDATPLPVLSAGGAPVLDDLAEWFR